MNMKRILLVFSVWLLTLTGVSIAQQDVRDVRFLLTFVPNIQFAPVYVADAAGYFEQARQSIMLEYLNEPDVIDLVAAGQADFGMVSGEQVILAASQQRPILYVYEWFQEYPVGIVVAEDSGVESIEDLQGMRVGLPGRFGASYSGLTALLLSAGLTERDVDLQEIGFSAPDVFCLGGAIDAATIYINNEPLQIQMRIDDEVCGDVSGIRIFPVSQAADLVSNGIITGQSLAADDPELVAATVDAFDAGLRLTIANPARAYLLSAPYVDNLPLSDTLREAMETLAEEQDAFLADNPDRDAIAASRTRMMEYLAERVTDAAELTQFEVLLASINLWDAESLGYSEPSSWEAMQSTLLEMGALDQSLDVEMLFTNMFIQSESGSQ